MPPRPIHSHIYSLLFSFFSTLPLFVVIFVSAHTSSVGSQQKRNFTKTKTTKSIKGQHRRTNPFCVFACRQTNGNETGEKRREEDLHLSDIIQYRQMALRVLANTLCFCSFAWRFVVGPKYQSTAHTRGCSFLLLFTLQQIHFNILIVSDAHSFHLFSIYTHFCRARMRPYKRLNKILFPITMRTIVSFARGCYRIS